MSVRTRCEIPNFLNYVQKVLQDGEVIEQDFAKPNGNFYLMRIIPYLLEITSDNISGAVISIHDITHKKLQEERLKLSASVFEYSSEGTIITDTANKIISVNPAFSKITGYSAEEVMGLDPKILSSGKADKYFYTQMWDSLKTTGLWQGEVENKRKNGEVYTERLSITVLKDDHGNIYRYIAVFSDISESKNAQKLLEWQANYDALTNLPNRKLVTDTLLHFLIRARRSNTMFAILYMDLDGFKNINDSLGHLIGDELIIEVGKIIKTCIRETDKLGRMGGDEFVVVLNNLKSSEEAMEVANKIINETHKPITLNGNNIQTGVSIGITIYPTDGESVETLLKNADNAMYEAKRSGKNQARYYTHQMQDEANRRHWIHQELSFALQRLQIDTHYQPVINLSNMELYGAEALMRWKHPQKGFIPPETFISIAEQYGLIVDLSDWLFEKVFLDFAQWHESLHIAINISIGQFISRNHIDKILTILKNNSAVQQGRVTLELTESVRYLANEEYRSILFKLKDYGCKLAIDDFGTGYSSLSYLKQIPVDILKIDKSFVKDIVHDEANASMVKAILQIAEAFNLNTVAEGVETKEQLDFLKESGCQFAQGYLFSRPIEQNAFLKFAQTQLSK